MTTLESLKMVVWEKCNFDFETTEMTEDSQLNRDLGLDSLDVVELCMEVEREFDIQISDVEVESWRTVEDVIQTIEKLKSK
jgi:acyl carrier protein